jgi:threonine/homoserine efflux transporter RhtA
MIAVLGGLNAAVLWATATLCSSRSSRLLGSRVVLAWIMIVGVVVGLPIAIASPPPATIAPSTFGLLLLSARL